MTRPRTRRRGPVEPDFLQELTDIERERHTIAVVEKILKEREEMLSLHEKKVVELKHDYDTRLKRITHREKWLAQQEKKLAGAVSHEKAAIKEFERVEKALHAAQDQLESIRDNISELRAKEQDVQVQTSRKLYDAKQAQKKFDAVHKNVENLLERHASLSKDVNDLEETLKQERKEVALLRNEKKTLENDLSKIKRTSTKETIQQLKITLNRINDAVKHKDMTFARSEYDVLRTVYQSLPPSERKDWYDKIAAVAHTLR